MTYEEALKSVTKKTSESGYLSFRFEYSKTLILPYKEGIAFLSALEKAEQLEDKYNTQPGVRCLDKDFVVVTLVSSQQYHNVKIAMLLGVSLETVEDMQRNPIRPMETPDDNQRS